MSEYHDESWLNDHVLGHVEIFASHHDDRLLAGDALADVVLVDAPVELACLECPEARRPAALVRVLHEVIDDVRRATAVDECPLNDRLQNGIRSRYHPAPACHARRLKRIHPATHFVSFDRRSGVADAQRSLRTRARETQSVLQPLQLPLHLALLKLELGCLRLERGDLRLLLLDERAQLADTVVVGELVLRHRQAAALVARHWPLRVELAVGLMIGQRIQLDDGRAAELLVCTLDLEARQEVAQDTRHRLELRPRQAATVDRTRRLADQPVADA